MSAQAFEALLARLYTDARLRRRFLRRPGALAHGADLSADEVRALLAIDCDGLELACASLEHKRAQATRLRVGWMLRSATQRLFGFIPGQRWSGRSTKR